MNLVTNLIRKKLLSLIILKLFGLTLSTYAQDEKSSETPFEISGSIDTYYTADFSGRDNISTSFADDRESLGIGILDVSLSKSFGKVSMLSNFSFGPRSFKSIPTFGEGENQMAVGIQNLYISYSLTKRLSLTAGYMGTFVGYEIISPVGNFNYSTSYLFTNGPFQNAGIKAEYAISDRVGVMIGIFNDWNVYIDTDGMKDIGTQLFLSPIEGFDIYLNFVKGKSSGTIFDITSGFQISDKFYIGLNAADFTFDNTKEGGYSGFALYPRVRLSNSFSLGLRTEYFTTKEIKDENGAILTENEHVFSTTISGNYILGELTFITEVRLDSSDDLGFLDKNNVATGKASQFTLAAIFAF